MEWRAWPALRKNTPMSSRASAATRDLTKALIAPRYGFQCLSRLIGFLPGVEMTSGLNRRG